MLPGFHYKRPYLDDADAIFAGARKRARGTVSAGEEVAVLPLPSSQAGSSSPQRGYDRPGSGVFGASEERSIEVEDSESDEEEPSMGEDGYPSETVMARLGRIGSILAGLSDEDLDAVMDALGVYSRGGRSRKESSVMESLEELVGMEETNLRDVEEMLVEGSWVGPSESEEEPESEGTCD